MTNTVRKEQQGAAARGFEALSTKSTWSSFDDITWDDFNGDDHSVPEPEPEEPLWLPRRRGNLLKESKEEGKGGRMNLEDEGSSMDVDNWDVGELGTVPDGLIGESGLTMVNQLKQDSPAALTLPDGLFSEADSAAGHFGYSPAEGGLFVEKGGTFGYAWENLEDMDNLFQNEESPFGQETDALMQWPPSSSASPDSSTPPVNTTTSTSTAEDISPELRAMKGKSLDEDLKMEFIPCERLRNGSEVSEVCVNNSEVERVRYIDQGEDVLAEGGRDQKTVDVVEKKRRKDRSRKQVQYMKKPQSMIQPKQQSLTHYSSAQVKPAVASSLQVYPPQVMGAPAMLGRSQYPGAVHHSPWSQGQHPPQPVMVCFEHPEAHQRQQQYEQKLEAIAPPPVSGSNMTPQEKIEKLRWKQKMHRLASEQQFAKQSISLDPAAKQKQGKIHGKKPVDGSLLCSVIKPDEADGRIVEANVLSQLLTVMSKLDMGSRICIRDALYRLAKSSVNRHATDGASSSECSITSAAEKTTLRYPMLETETNPIDRTIANLLFHKRSNTGGIPSEVDWSSWQREVSESEETGDEKGGTGGEQMTEMSSEDRESEGSSRRAGKFKACDGTTKARSSLKREASSEFLSSDQEDRGRGTNSRSDNPRDGKAARTSIQ